MAAQLTPSKPTISIEAIETVSRTVPRLLAESRDRPSDFFSGRMKEDPYLLMKTMSYLPQDPALDSLILPDAKEKREIEAEHVHRVIDPAENPQPFIFGEREWQQKAEGNWCYRNDCCRLV